MKSLQKIIYTLLSLVFIASLGVATGLYKIPLIVPIAYLVMGLVTFIAYLFDKDSAVHGAWRTREQTLHNLEFLCGWPGAMLAQVWLRHKNAKVPFQRAFWRMVILNVAILVILVMIVNE